MANVLIISTVRDLSGERKAAARALRLCHHSVRTAESCGPATGGLESEIRRWVEWSTCVVLLLGPRHGALVDDRSWTEKEFDWATELGKQVFAYKLDEDHPRYRKFPVDPELAESRERFIERVRGHVGNVPTFDNQGDLVAILVHHVVRWEIWTEVERQRLASQDSVD